MMSADVLFGDFSEDVERSLVWYMWQKCCSSLGVPFEGVKGIVCLAQSVDNLLVMLR